MAYSRYGVFPDHFGDSFRARRFAVRIEGNNSRGLRNPGYNALTFFSRGLFGLFLRVAFGDFFIGNFDDFQFSVPAETLAVLGDSVFDPSFPDFSNGDYCFSHVGWIIPRKSRALARPVTARHTYIYSFTGEATLNAEKTAVDEFLKVNRMHPEDVGIAETVEHIIEEMTKGLNGDGGSLAMIPTYMEVEADIPSNRSVVVLDAGGTNLRAALVSFSPELKPVIGDFSKHAMPGTRNGEVGKDEFFDSLAALVEPLIGHGEKIGFCFSYPTQIFPDKDGRLIQWTKEIKAPEVVGRMIGADLRNALHDRGVVDAPDVVILNDTVATLLTGKASQAGRHWGGYIGFILGTGLNSCYVESNAAINKLEALNPSRSQIINCELGSYTCRCRGTADENLGKKTSLPEAYWMEKMVAGGYFGALATETLMLAAGSGLLTPKMASALTSLGEISTKDADNYTHNPSDRLNALVSAVQESGNRSDAERIWYLIDALLERAARLTASALAAPVLKGAPGTGPLSPVCMTIDGTTYYRYYRFQARVESYLRPFLSKHNHYYETIRVDDAPLIGAAVAALTN